MNVTNKLNYSKTAIKLHSNPINTKNWRHSDITIKQTVSSSKALISLIIICAMKTLPPPGAETSPSHVNLYKQCPLYLMEWNNVDKKPCLNQQPLGYWFNTNDNWTMCSTDVTTVPLKKAILLKYMTVWKLFNLIFLDTMVLWFLSFFAEKLYTLK